MTRILSIASLVAVSVLGIGFAATEIGAAMRSGADPCATRWRGDAYMHALCARLRAAGAGEPGLWR